MSYYDNRIKALEERVAEMSRMQRMKAIPVEAKLVQRIAGLQAENKALRQAGNRLSNILHELMLNDYVFENAHHYEICEGMTDWNKARDTDLTK
jgi:hypothetical protein